ncbi:MAG: 5-(carboxyamino)imidazole ribonucleotide synthase [Gammaproteobacteria bacterium]|jgi:5-(carboxyamino)imidazole ribonucleotide synthase
MGNKTEKLSGKRIAIVGGGQLAKMTALSALQLGCDVLVLERKSEGPAINLASHSFVGDWDNPDDLINLAEHADVVTLENEFVDANSLSELEKAGHLLFPTAKSIGLVQDKFIQKQTLQEAGLPLSPFRAIESREDIIDVAREFNWPLVIKTRRNGYDGKGNATVNNESEIGAAWDKLDGDNRTLYAEAFCPFVSELAIIITTSKNGEVAAYPLVESVQRDHICHIVRAPAPVSDEITAKATDIARRAVAAIGAIGSFGVEMFLTKDNDVIVNELAPRVHNSGHYSIEACECSQFENHVRAVLGWPLGSTKMIKPAAVMVNLLGQGHGSGHPAGFNDALAMPGVHIHIYGKELSMLGRKMGHVTALGETLSEAEQAAQTAANVLIFGVSE